MSHYFVVDPEYGVGNDARIDTEATLDVHYFMGKRLADTFPPTVITLRSRLAAPDLFQVGSVVAVSERLRDFFRDEWETPSILSCALSKNVAPHPCATTS
jgi:hypothetical protein